MGENKASVYQGIDTLVFAGGGVCGIAHLELLKEAKNFGLELKNINSVYGCSAGAIMALAVALNLDLQEMEIEMEKMPISSFQDFSYLSFWLDLVRYLGFCKGETLEHYLVDLIERKTGLKDPTFEELANDARGFKDLRVIVTNLTKSKAEFFWAPKNDQQDKAKQGHKVFAPPKKNQKVAKMVAASCRIPILFRPARGDKGEYYVDGGFFVNYPIIQALAASGAAKTLGSFLLDKWGKKSLLHRLSRPINNLFSYLRALLSNFFISQTLGTDQCAKMCTVYISTEDVNLFNFSPSKEDLDKIKKQTRIAVQEQARVQEALNVHKDKKYALELSLLDQQAQLADRFYIQKDNVVVLSFEKNAEHSEEKANRVLQVLEKNYFSARKIQTVGSWEVHIALNELALEVLLSPVEPLQEPAEKTKNSIELLDDLAKQADLLEGGHNSMLYFRYKGKGAVKRCDKARQSLKQAGFQPTMYQAPDQVTAPFASLQVELKESGMSYSPGVCYRRRCTARLGS